MVLLLRYGRCISYAIGVIPLVFFLGFAYPYVFTQRHLFAALVVASLIPLVYIWYVHSPARPYQHLVYVIFTFFVAGLCISALLSGNPVKSFLGSWERFGSVIDWACVWIYLGVLIACFYDRALWLRLFRFIVVIATFIALYACMQLVPWFDLFFFGTRVFGTLGNPGFLAAYLLLSIGITFFVARSEQSALARNMYYLSAGIQIIALLLTQTRGAFIAFIGMVCIYTVRETVRAPYQKRTWALLAIIGISCVALLALPYFSRLSSTALYRDSIFSRSIVWQTALQGFRERPLFGWGEGNFITVFASYYDPRLYEGFAHSMWFDRAHNEFIDRLVLGGVFGFFLYGLFWSMVLWTAFKASRRDAAYTPILYALFGYALYLFFFFHSIGDVLLFAAIIAFLAVSQRDEATHFHPVKRIYAYGALVLSVGLVFYWPGRELYANYLVKEVSFRAVSERSDHYARAWRMSIPSRRVIAAELYEAVRAGGMGATTWRTDSIVIRNTIGEVARQYPHEVQYWMLLIDMYRRAAYEQPERLAQAVELADAAVKLAPTHPYMYHLRSFVGSDQLLATSPSGALGDRLWADIQRDAARSYELAPGARDTLLWYLGTRDDMGAWSAYVEQHRMALDPYERSLVLRSIQMWRVRGLLSSDPLDIEKALVL